MQPVTSIPRLATRPAESHKGDFGRIAVVAGSRDMPGAAILAGMGALRAGAGLVRVFTTESAHAIVASAEPSLMVVPLAEAERGFLSENSVAPLLSDLHWADVVALGPGLGQSAAIQNVVRAVAAGTELPLILDADGLNAAALIPEWWRTRRGRTIVTPHPGEMNRLRRGAGLREINEWTPERRAEAAAEMAGLLNVVVILKGAGTVVAEGRRIFVNKTGNPGMAAGGMGDVLTGVVAALLGARLDPFDAACLAVHAHGRAADRLSARVAPFGYTAREVADEIPIALCE